MRNLFMRLATLLFVLVLGNLTVQAECDAVTELHFVNIGANQVEVAWTPSVDPGVIQYVVDVNVNGALAASITLPAAGTSSATIVTPPGLLASANSIGVDVYSDCGPHSPKPSMLVQGIFTIDEIYEIGRLCDELSPKALQSRKFARDASPNILYLNMECFCNQWENYKQGKLGTSPFDQALNPSRTAEDAIVKVDLSDYIGPKCPFDYSKPKYTNNKTGGSRDISREFRLFASNENIVIVLPLVKDEIVKVEFYDMLGSLVHATAEMVQNSQAELTISNLPETMTSGIFIYKVSIGAEVYTGKLMK